MLDCLQACNHGITPIDLVDSSHVKRRNVKNILLFVPNACWERHHCNATTEDHGQSIRFSRESNTYLQQNNDLHHHHFLVTNNRQLIMIPSSKLPTQHLAQGEEEATHETPAACQVGVECALTFLIAIVAFLYSGCSQWHASVCKASRAASLLWLA